MAKVRHEDQIGLRIRVVLGDGLVIGPGRADLLHFIQETGSIAAAGRRMGMSYKRAWQLAEALNEAFSGPLIAANKGGAAGGGATLTALGIAVLRAYRDLQAQALASGAASLALLSAAMTRITPGDPADESIS
ncbi:MAG TPA: LysR family transcriptional regulator [Acidiphilium sp.]|nr:MAG: ModE family transcriptional regulator [Acidiphilium sp. 21-60-14]OYV92002.1 MAG: ModE family transcriptional regulator [Acidiphilium sp. 37-60-79]HQT89161.1 LysR family transcriptional regulator [Acidiphilium sp.]HQU24198.1 LysR family transcriptional regulator [Acidiphilium sp.]